MKVFLVGFQMERNCSTMGYSACKINGVKSRSEMANTVFEVVRPRFKTGP